MYNDGGAFIGIRAKTSSSSGGRKTAMPEELIVVEENGNAGCPVHDESYESMATDGSEAKPARRVTTRAEGFRKYYLESMGMKWLPRREYIASKMYKYFGSEVEMYDYLNRKMRNAYRAASARRTRGKRRAALHGLDLFGTFTYDDKKMTEEIFSKKLLNTLRHFASRKGWKYMGAWERGETGRLHFHALMHIPEGTMSGEMEHRREYDPVRKRMVEFDINTFFEKAFGRNTFEKVDGIALGYATAVSYIVKYLEKSGSRLVCSRGLRTFIETRIDNADILTPLHPNEPYDDRKYILFDDFKVWDRADRCLGTFNRNFLPQLRLVN